MLVVVSVGVALQGIYIIWCSWFTLTPSVFSAQETGLGAGSFINRNHAGLFLNLGLACSIGTIIWRQSINAKTIRKRSKITGDEILDTLTDPIKLAGSICAVICVTAILLSRSGVGAVGMFVGAIAAVRWFRSQQYAFALLAIILISLLTSVLLFQSSKSPSENPDSLLGKVLDIKNDARLSHWQDGVRAGTAYFPLGSGAGSYGNAYLPFQSSGNASWYEHADNYFLELFVEQGLPGLVLAFTVFWVTFPGSRQISRSQEFADKGLRAASSFSAGAIVATQVFDFSITLPANLFLVAVIAGSTVARSQVIRQRPNAGEALKLPIANQQVRIAVAAGVCLMLVSSIAASQLRWDAIEDHAIRHARQVLLHQKRDGIKLDHEIGRLSSLINERHSHQSLLAQSELLHQRARVAEVEAQELVGAGAINAAFRSNSISRRRLSTSPIMKEVKQAESLKLYVDAQALAIESLKRQPYSISPRSRLVYLDFLKPSITNTGKLIREMCQLLSRNPKQLLSLAKLAEEGQDIELASSIYKELANLSPAYVSYSVRYAIRQKSVNLTELISKAPECQMGAAKYLFNNWEVVENDSLETGEFLKQAVTLFDCERFTTNQEKSDCEFLAAMICFRVKMEDLGLELIKRSLTLTPASRSKRLIHIQKLHELKRSSEALLEARKARHYFPDDPRFQSFIDKMVREGLKEAGVDPNETNEIN